MADTTPAPVGADAALALLVAAVEAETGPGWDCNSYHPSLWPALKAARTALATAAQPERVPLTEAARDVLNERQRQISVEGWTPEYDDKEHLPNELALAAASYVCADEQDAPPAIWPWDWSWWKPSDRRRNLVKSGALILAEIERLDRAAARSAQGESNG